MKNRWGKHQGDVKMFTIPADKEGSLDKKTMEKMRKYAEQNPEDDIVVNIDLGVIKIPKYAFSGIVNMRKCFLPVSLEEIECFAFEETGLTEIDLRSTNIESWREVSHFAFKNCSSLRRVIPPKRMNSIYQFRDGYDEEVDLSLLDLPTFLPDFELPEGAWKHDDALNTVILPKNLEKIETFGSKKRNILILK